MRASTSPQNFQHSRPLRLKLVAKTIWNTFIHLLTDFQRVVLHILFVSLDVFCALSLDALSSFVGDFLGPRFDFFQEFLALGVLDFGFRSRVGEERKRSLAAEHQKVG